MPPDAAPQDLPSKRDEGTAARDGETITRDGVTITRDGGVTVAVAALPPARRLWLGATRWLAVVLGPLAAASMIAAGFGWLPSFVVLGLILAPAVLLRLAGDSAPVPAAGPEAVFRATPDRFDVTVVTGGVERSFNWPGGVVRAVCDGWLGSALAIEVAGRRRLELLHGHPRATRRRVAEALNDALADAAAQRAGGYNPGRADRARPRRSRHARLPRTGTGV